MAKNIVLFSDGTGNSSAKLFKTNVWRLYEALELSRPDQIAYYDDGVGTSSFKPYAILGGALGIGLKRNVRHLYAFLSRNFASGDSIYAFGFSRGAFTIRVLVGLVHDQGLAKGDTDAELERDVAARWWAYRKRARTRMAGKVRTRMFGRQPARRTARDDDVTFTFLGLWDTVNAYGLPVDELTRAWDHYVWPLSMNDRIPSQTIGKAFHALSIDDERNTFHPVLWTETDDDANTTSRHLNEERVSQVWFAGVHANVGGGYPDDSLAHVSLEWIMREADRLGVRFRHGELARARAAVAPNGPLNDSRKGVAGYYRYNPRKIAKLTADDFHQVSVPRPKIHASVFERMSDGDDRYAPIILPERYAVVRADNSIADAVPDARDSLPVTGTVESVSQSRARSVRQERVWNLVWARRIVYFATVATSVFLAVFPLYFKAAADGACLSEHFCFLSKPIGLAALVLPSFATFWIDAFTSHPNWFALGAGVLSVLLLLSRQLGRRIKDTMRLIWNPILAAPMTEVPAPPAPSSLIYRLRSCPAYQWFFRVLSRYVLPGFFAAAIYVAAAVLLSRGAFSITSAGGVGCTPSAERPLKDPFTFATHDICAATGYRLQAGARYEITIKIQDAWRDDDHATDVAGFSAEQMTWPMYVGLPFRRRLTEPWFKPIARIGAHGNDEYPLAPTDPFVAGDSKRELTAQIRARRDGQLFLYVNDAVFFWPWVHTYGNNAGTAIVTINRRHAE